VNHDRVILTIGFVGIQLQLKEPTSKMVQMVVRGIDIVTTLVDEKNRVHPRISAPRKKVYDLQADSAQLGISEKVSFNTIRNAYLRDMRRYHPDKNQGVCYKRYDKT